MGAFWRAVTMLSCVLRVAVFGTDSLPHSGALNFLHAAGKIQVSTDADDIALAARSQLAMSASKIQANDIALGARSNSAATRLQQNASFLGPASSSSPPVGPHSVAEECPLPEGARWCQVKSPEFNMAVYPNDIVGDSVCKTGTWENIPFEQIEAKVPESGRVMMDIGAHYGFFALSFAMRGWHVEAFEVMPRNTALLEATICRYPDLKKQINIHHVALGHRNRKELCSAYSPETNVGDATVCCPGDECGGPRHAATNPTFVHRGDFAMRTLDSLLGAEVPVQTEQVGFVKIDVEGYECGVIQGARRLLEEVRPILFQSEVNTFHTSVCPPKEYLKKYKDSGYEVRSGGFDGPLVDITSLQIPEMSADNYFMERQDSGPREASKDSMLAKPAANGSTGT